jgi:hypothetical protein
MTTTIPELLLVRDCLHCCQGGQGGRYIECCENDGKEGLYSSYDVLKEFVVSNDGKRGAEHVVTLPQRQLIQKITHVGTLVRTINSSIHAESTNKSIVHEAIKAACQKEVRSCYRVIALLESQAQGTPADGRSEPHSDTDGVKKVRGELSALTLRRTLVWLDKVSQQLEIVSLCLTETLRLRGGEALNLLFKNSKHGDKFVVDTIAPLLNAASAPYFMQLEQWITQGIVPQMTSLQRGGRVISKIIDYDHNTGNFMILRIRTPKDHPCDDWKEGFAIDETATPKDFDPTLAREILTVGKAVYFLRKYCDDEKDWDDALNRLQHAGQLTRVGADLTAQQRLDILKLLVGEAKEVMDEKMLFVLKEKENIFWHLDNIKRFVLLSKGDFVQVFIDLADEELSAPASDFSEYTLQGHVEKSLQYCNAIDIRNREISDRIVVRKTKELHAASEESGWNLFSLGYALPRDDSPAALVLDPISMKMYEDISSILWSMKRSEYITGLSWRRLEEITRLLNSLRLLEREHGIDLQSTIGNVPILLRYLHSLRADIAQFVSTLQSHLVYRVIEPAWKTMLSEMMVAKDVDGLLEAHNIALKTIAKGTFNDRKKRSTSGSSNSGEIKASLNAALSAGMDVNVPVDELFVIVDECVSSHHKYFAQVKESERVGIWNSSNDRPSLPRISDETLEDIKRSVVRLYGIFSRHRDMFYSNLPSATRENLCR